MWAFKDRAVIAFGVCTWKEMANSWRCGWAVGVGSPLEWAEWVISPIYPFTLSQFLIHHTDSLSLSRLFIWSGVQSWSIVNIVTQQNTADLGQQKSNKPSTISVKVMFSLSFNCLIKRLFSTHVCSKRMQCRATLEGRVTLTYSAIHSAAEQGRCGIWYLKFVHEKVSRRFASHQTALLRPETQNKCESLQD